MVDWKKLKADISKGIKEGLEGVKDGAEIVGKKAGEVTAETQRRIKVHQAKRRIQDLMEELGAASYELEKQSPGTLGDPVLHGILTRIDAAHEDLKKLEAEGRSL